VGFARFEVFTAVKIQVEVFWFGLKIEAAGLSKTLVSYHITTHGVTTQKSST
jgi:hypothetical protein